MDLVEWGRSNREEAVQTFPDVLELADYIRSTDKIFRFPKDQDEHVVLRHLLRKIFR